MATLRSAFLCQSARPHDNGLISALGINIREMMVPAYPALLRATFVAWSISMALVSRPWRTAIGARGFVEGMR